MNKEGSKLKPPIIPNEIMRGILNKKGTGSQSKVCHQTLTVLVLLKTRFRIGCL